MKIITLEGVIGWDIYAENIRKQLPTGSERVRVDINSPGGDVFEAFAIYNALKDYKGKVIARVVGLAASAAADIFFGADEREVFTHAAVMYHRAWSLAIGNANQLRAEAKILDDLDNIRIQDFARVTGKSEDEAMAEFSDETWLIGAKQIMEKGIAVSVIDGEEEGETITEPVARARVAESVKLLKAEKNSRENVYAELKQKIAAMAKPQVTAAQAGDNNLRKEARLKTLAEFMAQNPEAEKDVLAYAGPKLSSGLQDEAKKAESKRISELLALAGVRVSDDVKAAIDRGTSPEAYAKDALLKQREIEARLAGKPNNLNPGKVNHDLMPGNDDLPKGETVTAESLKEISRGLAGRG